MVTCNDFGQTMCGPLSPEGGGAIGNTYEYAKAHGFLGTEEEFNNGLIRVVVNSKLIDAAYKRLVLNAKSTAEVDSLFKEWWMANATVETDRNVLVGRWFTEILDDDRVYGVKLPHFKTSKAPTGEFTDDSVGMVCEPSTAAAANRDDFAFQPQFWTLEVSMDRHMDGTHTINKVEHIDKLDDVRSGKFGLAQVLQKNTYIVEYDEGGYHYFKQCCHPKSVLQYHRWPQGKGKDGKEYPYYANPKYAVAGVLPDGTFACGTGLMPALFESQNTGVIKWNRVGPQYSGASGNLLYWAIRMMWLKYARKGNSGKLEGCTGYSFQYRAAASEQGVERILVTPSEAGNILIGSTISIGSLKDNQTDRGYGDTRDLADRVEVVSIEDVTIGDVAYKAVYVNNGGKTFDTVAGTTIVSSMPYRTGYNDRVLGYDGSRTNPSGGKEPMLIQRVEIMHGAYLIPSDELWEWSQPGGAEADFCFDCYYCHDQSKVSSSGTITSDYTKLEGHTLKFPAGTPDSWGDWYIEDIADTGEAGVLWPSAVSKEAGSGTGVMDFFSLYPRSSGVRAAWCLGSLAAYGAAGLAARSSAFGPSYSRWFGSVGCPSGISG